MALPSIRRGTRWLSWRGRCAGEAWVADPAPRAPGGPGGGPRSGAPPGPVGQPGAVRDRWGGAPPPAHRRVRSRGVRLVPWSPPRGAGLSRGKSAAADR